MSQLLQAARCYDPLYASKMAKVVNVLDLKKPKRIKTVGNSVRVGVVDRRLASRKPSQHVRDYQAFGYLERQSGQA